MCSKAGYLHLVIPAQTDGTNWEKHYPAGRGSYEDR